MVKHNFSKGRFLCLEGGDAVGKTTMASLVGAQLELAGKPVTVVKKRDLSFAEGFIFDRLTDLQRVLWDYPEDANIAEWGDQHWFHLLASWFSIWDRQRIQPLLAQGRWVIVDGWYYKYLARFMLKDAFQSQYLKDSFAHLTMPDCTAWLQMAPELAAVRRQTHKATESGALDGTAGGAAGFVSYQSSVQSQLQLLASRYHWNMIEANQSKHDVVSEICLAFMRDDEHINSSSIVQDPELLQREGK